MSALDVVTALEPAPTVGPANLAAVMAELDQQSAHGDRALFQPLPTGFTPLDDVLNGGLRAGELLILGGAFGVGKTIFCLQAARNTVFDYPDTAAMYVCYEHDRAHLLLRMLCLESAETGSADSVLTLRRLASMAMEEESRDGLLSRLRESRAYAPVVAALDRYAPRLTLVKASGAHSTLAQLTVWANQLAAASPRALLVVDYLQKIPLEHTSLLDESEATTYLVQGLKELAMNTGLRIIAIAASDRMGLKARRMRLADLRGSSALQYEADVGIVLNNKFDIVSREHMVYNLTQADTMRNWVVLSVEKNRAGRNAVDMEFQLDAAHFRMDRRGGYVRERLIDDKLTLA
jgi:replicative DNA helicase